MVEQRDPITCTSCGTVNSWMVETCRTCGAELSASKNDGDEAAGERQNEEEPESISDDRSTGDMNGEMRTPPIKTGRRRWNIFWLVLAGFAYIAVLFVGQWAIARFMIAPDKERAAAFAEMAQNPENLNTFQRETYRSLFSTVIATALAMVVLTPVIVGSVVGYFSRTIVEAAVGVGLGSVFFLLSEGQLAAALVGGPMTAGLGALGALAANFFRLRWSSPHSAQ